MTSIRAIGLLLTASAFIGCASLYVSVLEQSADTVVLRAKASTPEEAVIRAKTRGREIIGGNVTMTKDASCSQEFSRMGDSAHTFWICVVTLKKAE